jgi:hypothetical protein
VTKIYEVYDEQGKFKAMFHDHPSEAQDFVRNNQPYENAWEICIVTREGIGQE